MGAPTPDADNGGLVLAPGFRALVVADNLVVGRQHGRSFDKLRGLALAPNGDIYAKLLLGGVLALRDEDGDGRIDTVKEFGPGDGGTHIQFHDGWLFHSSRNSLYRQRYIPGELVPTSPSEIVVRDLPAEKDHDAKAFAFDDHGGVLVEVGSPFNVFSEGDRVRGATGKTPEQIEAFQNTYGGFWRFDANRLNQTEADGRRFSTGHRHVVALAWHPQARAFFMAMMGRDQLNTIAPEYYDHLDNAERVAEEFHLLSEGANFGWPTTYWDPIKEARMVAPEYGGDGRKRNDDPGFQKPLIAFPAHWAPLQMVAYEGKQFPDKYRRGIFITFRGSWNRAPRPQAGYRLVFVPFGKNGLPTGNYETFADNFAGLDYFVSNRDARYRPGGLAVGPDGSLYVGDTEKGRIWRIIYTGEESPKTPGGNVSILAPVTGQPALADTDTLGGKIYLQICAACHMPDGTGAPGRAPTLVRNDVVSGDPARLIDVLLRGPAAVLADDREKFPIVMPGYGGAYSDEEIAGVVNFLRRNFGADAEPVIPGQVTPRRKVR